MNSNSIAGNLLKLASEGKLTRFTALWEKTDNDLRSAVVRSGLLHQAAIHCRTCICKFLVEQGVSINATDSNGCTPVLLASRQGHLETVEYLLTQKADTSAPNSDGATALYEATDNGHIEVMKFLLAHGADVNDLSHASNERFNPKATPLQLAARRGDVDGISILLDYKANPNYKISQYLCPLCAAISAKSLKGVGLLLRKGANPNEACMRTSPLHFAVSDGLPGMIDLLIESGANANEVDPNLLTPLELAASISHNEHFTKLLGYTRKLDWYSDMNFHTIRSQVYSEHVINQKKKKRIEMAEGTFNTAMHIFHVDKDHPRALVHLDWVVSICPWHLEVHLERANVLYMMGDDEAAILALDACSCLDPTIMDRSLRLYHIAVELILI